MKRFKMNLMGKKTLIRLRLDILLSDKTFTLRIKSKSPPEFAVWLSTFMWTELDYKTCWKLKYKWFPFTGSYNHEWLIFSSLIPSLALGIKALTLTVFLSDGACQCVKQLSSPSFLSPKLRFTLQGTKSRDSDNTFKSVWKRCQNTFTVMVWGGVGVGGRGECGSCAC